MNDIDFALNAFFDAYETVLKLNVRTGDMIFLKHTGSNIPLNTVHSFSLCIRNFFSAIPVHPNDVCKFEYFLNLKHLKKRCEQNQGGVLFSYRQLKNGEYSWHRIIISIPQSYSEESPYILFYRRLLPVGEADQEEALEAFQKKIHKVAKYNLTSNTYRILKQRPSEEYIKRKYSKRNLLSEEWLVEESLIHPDDITHFKHFTSHSFILDYFHDGNDELSFFYRRKIGSFYRWVKLSITCSLEYDENNKSFLYIIEDIDMILTNLLDQHGFFQYSTLKASRDNQKEIYYDNLLHALSYFTQRYLDVYMVDLKNDLYIMYKIRQENLSGEFPYVGSYSSISSQMSSEENRPQIKETTEQYVSLESLKEGLLDKASMEFIFRHPNGQLAKTTCTKIESINGIPSKVICSTVLYQAEHRLRVKTFGNFDVLDTEGKPLKFSRKQAKELFAYLVDQQGYPVSSKDIIQDVFERDPDDLNAIKYVSTLYRSASRDLEKAGYTDIIVKEWNSLRVETDKLDCDYYHLLNGDAAYLRQYHNEYMKEYSWAEETNAEILHSSSR